METYKQKRDYNAHTVRHESPNRSADSRDIGGRDAAKQGKTSLK